MHRFVSELLYQGEQNHACDDTHQETADVSGSERGDMPVPPWFGFVIKVVHGFSSYCTPLLENIRT